jgi:mitogen-activated protein kinase 7
MQRHTLTAFNTTFVIGSEYEFRKELGQGVYGCVIAAKHKRTGEECAIKKITNISSKACAYLVRTYHWSWATHWCQCKTRAVMRDRC